MCGRTPTVSHGSSDTIPTMWGCTHFENTRRHGTHNFENQPDQNVNFTLCCTMHFRNECASEPLRCPTVPATPFPQCEVVPTSRTPADTVHIFLKNWRNKMSTLYYVIRLISTNEYAREPLRCPTVPTTPSRPCEVAPTSGILRHKKHVFSKIGPSKMLTLHYVTRGSYPHLLYICCIVVI